jgi:GDP-D-mannose dehydratase
MRRAGHWVPFPDHRYVAALNHLFWPRRRYFQHRAHRPSLPRPDEPDVRFKLQYGDLTDGTSLIRIIQEVRPTETYNLAGARCK